jgi:hypothetical protein
MIPLLSLLKQIMQMKIKAKKGFIMRRLCVLFGILLVIVFASGCGSNSSDPIGGSSTSSTGGSGTGACVVNAGVMICYQGSSVDGTYCNKIHTDQGLSVVWHPGQTCAAYGYSQCFDQGGGVTSCN